MKAVVKEIQVGGAEIVHSLGQACIAFHQAVLDDKSNFRPKLNFAIELPNGVTKHITIRDDGAIWDSDETVAYGDFEDLPSALDYAREVIHECGSVCDFIEKESGT